MACDGDDGETMTNPEPAGTTGPQMRMTKAMAREIWMTAFRETYRGGVMSDVALKRAGRQFSEWWETNHE